ncbi:MAG: DUF433 domain-containing protein [Candidatus Lokiarchaeota archaeon]|nr:DUF433 domain-containing protein [Candidatus Lokiarchaeota archaeon]
MSDIIESNPEILGGKLVIKGTRIPVSLIFELIGLKYSLNEILEEYPTLNKSILLKLLEIARDTKQNLIDVDLNKMLSEELLKI